MAASARLAKVTAPRGARIVLRRRLFRLLDQPRRIVWVVAPPGAGKTALVASWLRHRRLRHVWLQVDEGDGDVATFFHYLGIAAGGARRLPAFAPEYLAAPSGFARTFFRALLSQRSPPGVLVLDDYHQLRTDSPVHAALSDGLAELPEGTTAVVISRDEPPVEMSRHLASGELEVVRGDQLSLTRREADAVAKLWGYSGHDRRAVLGAYPQTEGWAAGLVLLLAGWRRGQEGQEARRWQQALFGYFAQEILERADPEVRTVLLRAALLPLVTAPMAVELSGVPHAGEILAGVASRGYFVVQLPGAVPTYQYHALFREFLQERLEQAIASGEERAELRHRAGRLLEGADRIEDALALYARAGAWDEVGRVVRAHAPSLLREGRVETVARWVLAMPDERRTGDPWLLLWGAKATLFREPRQAQAALHRAFELFRGAGEPAGTYLALAAMAEAHFFALDDFSPLDAWIALLEEVRQQFPTIPDPEVELEVVAAAFTAITHRQPWHPALAEWEERALAAALAPVEARRRWKVGQSLLLYYGWWCADLVRARLLTDALRPLSSTSRADPASAILWHLADANLALFRAHPADCLRLGERGLAIAAESGLRMWSPMLLAQRAFAALTMGDLEAAQAVIERLTAAGEPPTRFGAIMFHFTAAVVARHRGEAVLAREHGRLAVELAVAGGAPMAEAVCRLTWGLTQPPAAGERELERAGALARRSGVRVFLAGSLLGRAVAARQLGNERLAVELIADGFDVGRTMGTRGYPWLLREELSDCCALALEHGIEVEHVREVIRAQHLAPGNTARDLEEWPWELRIEALEGLEVRRAGERLEPGRKAQRKPLDLLKVLVGSGPRGMQQDAVAGALWPEAEGDAARQALRTTVHRLRRLLGSAEAVLQGEARVALDAGRVYVDLWAWGWRLDRLESRRTSAEEQARIRERLRDRFGAGVPAGDEEDPLLGEARRHLRGRVRRCLARPSPDVR
jgi:hypothetical protein